MSARVARTIVRLLTALALTAGALATTAGPAAAKPQPMGRCTTSSGAVLAVDFGDWGGPILRSCGTTPTTGYELLNQGGWRTTGTGHDGPAFICRIGYAGHQGGRQYPPPSQEDCVLTPPASAYWSYWHADPGRNTWTYSQLGAMLYKPRPGSVDLWIFGGTNIEGTTGRPTVTPDQLRARNTRPTGGGAPQNGFETDAAEPPAPGTDTGPAPGRPVQEKPAPKPSPSPTSASPSASPSKSPPRSAAKSPSPSASTRAEPGAVAAAPEPSRQIVDADPTADAPHDSGSIVPTVLTAAATLAIGLAGGYAVRRRRRTE
ncbi:hypothetical protein [Streptomyces sp. NPDC058653]|uniref:hypothetical protein n=1 Tax=Streptomyces sp. NPDC058653 TaxID=3346576 RepID=UPI003652D49D